MDGNEGAGITRPPQKRDHGGPKIPGMFLLLAAEVVRVTLIYHIASLITKDYTQKTQLIQNLRFSLKAKTYRKDWEIKVQFI